MLLWWSALTDQYLWLCLWWLSELTDNGWGLIPARGIGVFGAFMAKHAKSTHVYLFAGQDLRTAKNIFIKLDIEEFCQSQWLRSLRCRSAAARLLRSWVRIPQGAWMFVCCECCVLSGRGLCNELSSRPEESYRLWCVVVYDIENLKKEEAMTRIGLQCHRKKKLRCSTKMY